MKGGQKTITIASKCLEWFVIDVMKMFLLRELHYTARYYVYWNYFIIFPSNKYCDYRVPGGTS